jgi:hypothetical protein
LINFLLRAIELRFVERRGTPRLYIRVIHVIRAIRVIRVIRGQLLNFVPFVDKNSKSGTFSQKAHFLQVLIGISLQGKKIV